MQFYTPPNTNQVGTIYHVDEFREFDGSDKGKPINREPIHFMVYNNYLKFHLDHGHILTVIYNEEKEMIEYSISTEKNIKDAPIIHYMNIDKFVELLFPVTLNPISKYKRMLAAPEANFGVLNG